MQIEAYNKQRLDEYIHSDLFRNQPNIPISFHRAVSQINNPSCSDEDILLWAAYEKEALAGYVGILPDTISTNGIEKKIYWLSCFWVDDNFRETNLASQLLFLLIKHYRNDLYISNFLFSLEKMYQSLGIFQPTQYLYGKVFFCRLDFSSLLEARYPPLKPFIPLYIVMEKIANTIISPLLKAFNKRNEPQIKIVNDTHFDNELKSFLVSFKEAEFVRSTSFFRWITNYPWVLEGKADADSKRYYFSSKASEFEYVSLKLYEQNELVGYAFLRIRNKKLTISYVYTNDNYIADLGLYIYLLAQKRKLISVACFDKRLLHYFEQTKGFAFVKNEKRPFIFPKKSDITISLFQEGDGDSVFT